MGKKHRPQMLGEEIRKIISNLLLLGKLKDPAFTNMVSVSGVDVSGDSSYATVYVTALSFDPAKGIDDETKKQILDAFTKCKGFIRSEIAKNIKLRYAPELVFKFDNSFEYGAKMDALIDSLDIKPADPEEDDEL
jgi:ribosome-binding factor A